MRPVQRSVPRAPRRNAVRQPLALALLMALVVACSGPPDVTSGTVTSKEDNPSHDEPTSVCMAYDPKTFVCTFSVPSTTTVSESWTLCLRDDTEDRPVDQRDTGCVDVDQSTYNRYSVGEHYP